MTTTRTRFVPNPMLAQEVLRATMLLDDLQAIAENIAEQAVAIAPEDEGDYLRSIEAVSGFDARGVMARVNANDWKAALIEFGTTDTPVFAPIRRAADRYGAVRP